MVKRDGIKWTICVATVPPRAKKLQRMMDRLLPQVEGKPIEILILFNNFEHNRGVLRQMMMDEARGEYISHIDDDDVVPKDFVETILPLLDGVDYIGFRLVLKNEDRVYPPVYHSLKYNAWTQDDDGYYRGVTHVNPIKAELARKGRFPDVDNGEDFQWAQSIHQYMNSQDREFTEHYIDKVMYIYDHFAHKEMKRTPRERLERPIFKSKNVRFHPRSSKPE